MSVTFLARVHVVGPRSKEFQHFVVLRLMLGCMFYGMHGYINRYINFLLVKIAAPVVLVFKSCNFLKQRSGEKEGKRDCRSLNKVAG